MSKFRGDDADRLNNPDSWDDDDLIYLADRGMLPAGFNVPEGLMSEPVMAAIGTIPHLGDAGLIRDSDPANPSLEDPDPTFDDDIDFDEMHKPQLRQEARNRNLDDGGTVYELRDRLNEFESGN